MSKRRVSRRLPSSDQMARGLFLDFEGFAPYQKGPFRPPAMVGYRTGCDGPVTQVVFSKKLRWAAQYSGLLYHDSWKEFVKDLIGKKKGSVFAFSAYEQLVIKKATELHYKRTYQNVKLIVEKHWPEGCQRPKDEKESLDRFVAWSPFELPRTYGLGKVTSRLREVMEYGSSEKRWESAPARVRKKWKGVLTHNEFDVTILGKLLVWCKDSKESGTKPRADQ